MVRQHYRWAVFIVVFLLGSVYFFLFSESGLLERIVLEKEKNRIAADIETLKSENTGYQRLLNKYRKGEYPEGDIVSSGYVKNGGTVLFLQGIKEKNSGAQRIIVPSGASPVPLSYLRIAWIGISAIVIAALIFYGRKISEQTT